MTQSRKVQQRIKNPPQALLASVVFLVLMVCNSSFAFERYNNGCMDCHGAFTDAISTKGSIFPDDSKHKMHKDTMGTECNLCHTSGDGKDPFIGSSNGTANNAGLGCNGCHNADGLRAHHAINGVTECADCHDAGVPPAENVVPPYYGTADTLADNPCNDVLASNTNENWTVGDFVGTDNDGDNLYDLADFDCGPPYLITAIAIEGNNVRITWNSAGGRRDMLQVASSLTNNFTNVGSAIQHHGVGAVSTNTVEVSGATSSARFYRIRYAP